MNKVSWKMLASSAAALCMTAVVWAAVPCDQKSECTSAKAAQAKLVTTVKTCDGEKSRSTGKAVAQVNAEGACTARTTAKSECCPVEKAARAYWASVLEMQESTDKEFCAGGVALKGLMAVVGEDEQYAPMVAKLEAWMAEQTAPVAAQVNATSDCAKSCDGAARAVAQVNKTCDATKKVAQVNAGTCNASKQVAQINAKSCDGDKKVAQINAKGECAKTCDSDKKVAQINANGECVKTCDSDKKVAQINAKDGRCESDAKRVAQVNAKGECAKSCDGDKRVAQINAKDECVKTCDGDKKVAQINAKGECAKSCDGAVKGVAQINAKDGCCASDAKRVAQVNAKGECAKSCDGDKAATAKFVALDCGKCDGVARAAAKAYMNIMVELKKVAGYEGCPMAAAKQTLAAVMQDIQTNRAQAAADAPEATEATAVSMGAMSEKADKAGCCSKK